MTRTLILAACLVAVPAVAHDWYPLDCCHDNDCRVALPGEVEETVGGWRVVPSDERFTFRQARYSPDGKYHRCLKDPKDVRSKTLCLFVPSQGS